MWRNTLVEMRGGNASVHWPGVLFALEVTAVAHWICYMLIRSVVNLEVLPPVLMSAVFCISLTRFGVWLHLRFPQPDESDQNNGRIRATTSTAKFRTSIGQREFRPARTFEVARNNVPLSPFVYFVPFVVT
jgi:hypothetical protein